MEPINGPFFKGEEDPYSKAYLHPPPLTLLFHVPAAPDVEQMIQTSLKSLVNMPLPEAKTQAAEKQSHREKRGINKTGDTA